MSDLRTDALEDYNPFGDPSASTRVLSNSQPAVLPSSDPLSPPDYSHIADLDNGPTQDSEGTLLASTQAAMTVADLQRRQAELDQRAAQLDLREKRAQQQEAWRMEHNYGTADIPNWPPLPQWCCFKPWVRIDFISDIPSQCRWMAMYAHYFWLAYSCLLLLNIFGTMSYFMTLSTSGVSGSLFGVSIIVFFLLTPASFFCWNRPLYRALKKNSSMQFCLFFPFFGIQILIILIQLLGIDYLGACGWINSLKVYSLSHGVGAFMLFLAALFSAAAAIAVYPILKVHMYYRGSGASLRHAKQELTRDVVGGSFAAVS